MADFEKLDNGGDEKAPFVEEENQSKSSDDLIEELTRHRTWKYTLLVFSISLSWTAGPSSVYITSFAGVSPKANDTWSCVSEKCFNMTAADANLLQVFPCEITEEVDGKEQLILGPSDIKWDLPHTSFSIEFDLYCDVGSRKAQQTLLSSMYFPGALIGLLVGGFLFDHAGRKRASLIAMIASFGIHLSGTFCHNFSFLLAIRFFQGLSEYMAQTGMLILQMELMPASFRNLLNGFGAVMWAAGYPIVAAMGYFVHDWNYMFLMTSIALLVTRLHLFIFLIESPRYYLIKNDVKTAKKSFKALAAMTTTDLDFDKIDIVDTGKTKEREQSIMQQLRELLKYPVVLKETLLVMVLWFFIAMFFYGFNFGWDAIAPNKYLGYMMGGFGELIATFMVVPLIHRLGRRRAMILLHTGAALIFLIAIPPVSVGNGWTLESICCLFGITLVSGCFTGIYLWTGEVAPTSHRGFAYGFGSGAARIGSFIGPYIFNNLAPITHRAVPFSCLAVASLLCAVASFLLMETGDKEIACVAADVEARRKGYRFRI